MRFYFFKPRTSDTFGMAAFFSNRHPHFYSFATHPAVGGEGYDIRIVQELLGHRDVWTTMTYTHVLDRSGKDMRSPADTLSYLGSSGAYADPHTTPRENDIAKEKARRFATCGRRG
jgi:hypothetical protein